MPLIRRLPKRGFINEFKTTFRIANLGQLEGLFQDGETVGPKELEAKGIIDRTNSPLKILGGGTFTKRLEISAHRFSQKSLEVIQKAGGTVVLLKKSGDT